VGTCATQKLYPPTKIALRQAIRQIAIQRLTSSDACNASPVCAQRFSTVVRRQLQSKLPKERLEASNWMVWIESVSQSESPQKRWQDGLPVLPDSAIRQLWDIAINDRNVICKSPEDFKAWSQNLGHEQVLTTFLSYGEVPCDRQGEIIRSLATPEQGEPSNITRIVKVVAKELRNAGVDISR